jgi:E3 ubiquitin-protein ligase HUWE1
MGGTGQTERFVAFAERHRTTVNLYIRQDKALLHNASFSPLVRFPKLLDFDNKKYYFRSELKRRNANQRFGSVRLCVRRDYVFEDSFHHIVLRKPEELKGKLNIVFQGEEGVDAGGLTREWYLTLSKQMLNPDKALFIHMSNGLTYQPNPSSHIQPDHLKYFKFAGQVVGKALWDEQLLDAHFTLSMYKHLLNLPIGYQDVEAVDPDFFRNLKWMLDNDISDVLDETFSIVRSQFGEVLTIDLKPNGRNIPVTEENKHEYVQLVAEQHLTTAIREQIDAFKEGFQELMPPELINIFTPSELELLMCGLPNIDVEDLKANTEYSGYTRDSPQIKWYWSFVHSLSQEDLARLVQFVTGTSQVPMEGFKALKGMNGPQRFNIHRCGDSQRLPSSHTCFNQLDLPEYSSEEQLHRLLLTACREGFQGFGFS